MQVVINSLLVNYSKTGSGPVLLLLHGWGDNLKTFNQLQNKLSDKFEVVSLDLPGFGGTEAPKEVWNLDNYAEFVKAFTDKAGLKNIALILGHSNGGAVAIRGLSLGVLKADKLILLAAAGVRDKDKAKKLATKVVAKTGKAATFWLPKHKKQALQKKLYGVVGSDMLVAPHLQETFKKTVAQDVQADAAKLDLPTLLIYAQNDKAVPLEYGELMANLIKGSKLVVVSDAEHFVHHDQPEQVEKLIREFANA